MFENRGFPFARSTGKTGFRSTASARLRVARSSVSRPMVVTRWSSWIFLQIFKIFLRIMVNSFWEVLWDTIIIPADHSAYRTVPSTVDHFWHTVPLLGVSRGSGFQVSTLPPLVHPGSGGQTQRGGGLDNLSPAGRFLSPLIFHRSCSRLTWMYRMKVSVQNLQLAHFGSTMRTFCSFHPTYFKTQRWFFFEGLVHLVWWTPHRAMCHCPPFRCIAARSFHMQYANMLFFWWLQQVLPGWCQSLEGYSSPHQCGEKTAEGPRAAGSGAEGRSRLGGFCGHHEFLQMTFPAPKTWCSGKR